MRFISKKRRQVPGVIIIPLIDILLVLLIFLVVTTTFKQQPAIQLSLPESNQTENTLPSENNLLVTIDKAVPHYYFGARSITLKRLEEELLKATAQNTNLTLSVATDEQTPIGPVIKVMDIGKIAGFSDINVFTQESKD